MGVHQLIHVDGERRIKDGLATGIDIIVIEITRAILNNGVVSRRFICLPFGLCWGHGGRQDM